MRGRAANANDGKSRPVTSGPAAAATRRRERGKPVKVTITQELGAAPRALLERALEEAGFWTHIKQARRARGRSSAFRIIVKPDLDCYDARAPAGTDSVLIEHLIDLLHDRDFCDVAVGDGRNDPDAWLHNREPLVVPDLVGYRFATEKGRAYEVVDLRGAQPAPAAAAGGLCTPISSHWSEASYRINFAKNKTHEDCAFALCVHNLAGVVAALEINGAPRRRAVEDDCLQVLRRAPPDFNLIDAFVSWHGGAGQRAPRRLETHAFIASTDALLADWAGAARMGLDPYASPVNSAALRNIGLPARYKIDGDLAPYPLWRNVHPLLAHSARLRNRADALGEIAAAWFQSVDREHFPLKDFYNDRINALVAPLMTQIDENPRSFLAVVLLNYAIAFIGSAILAQHTMFAKSRLRRRVAPLTLDPAAYRAADYHAIPGYLEPYQRLLESLPPNRTGLRWRYVEGSILFSCAYVFAIPYRRFTAAVDITRAIQYMNDYIGGSTVTVRRDARRRIVQQVERNLYLQQPNWLAALGGEVIDVEKLETISYHDDRQTICWRTVASANGSASHDDGSVSFVRAARGQTSVSIFARQKFALPLFFQLFDVNMAPGIRDPIIESAYTTFFAGTIANLRAAYDGTDFRIGRDASEAGDPRRLGQGELPRYLATAAAALAELLSHRGDVADLGQWLFASDGGKSPRAAAQRQAIDRDGFRHFRPTPGGTGQAGGRGDEQIVAGMAALVGDAPDFLAGLADALHKDLDRMANPDAAVAGE